MPDSGGVLSPEDNAKIQSWWSQHWVNPVTCPVCKTTEWIQAPHVVNIPRHAVDAMTINTISYPHIVVTCKNCAPSMFFNAVQIGVSTPASNPLPQIPLASLPHPLANALASAPPPTNPFNALSKKD